MLDVATAVDFSTETYLQVGSCQIHCIFWEGRVSHNAVYIINDLRKGTVTEQMATMGLWHMDDEEIPSELGLECNQPLTAIRYGHGSMFLQDRGGLVWYDVRIRGA
jgi:hypothetical protein